MRQNVFKRWTVGRATGLGFLSGLASVILWPLFAAYQDPIQVPYIAALLVTAFCGLSILLMASYDFAKNPRRGVKIRPIRSFDFAVSMLFLVPPVLALEAMF